MASGYSKTPLYRKLGMKEGDRILLYNPPTDYWEHFKITPPKVETVEEWQEESIEFVHVFCQTIETFEKISIQYKKAIKRNGMLWISWPKMRSNIPSDLKRDYIREYLLNNGLVDVKIASFNEQWSALKFVYRLKDR